MCLYRVQWRGQRTEISALLVIAVCSTLQRRHVTVCFQIVVVTVKLITTPLHVLRATLGTSAARIFSACLSDAYFNIAKRDLDSLNELSVTPACVLSFASADQ
jgi:hypothetical protein